jgi:hypothetical protein
MVNALSQQHLMRLSGYGTYRVDKSFADFLRQMRIYLKSTLALMVKLFWSVQSMAQSLYGMWKRAEKFGA